MRRLMRHGIVAGAVALAAIVIWAARPLPGATQLTGEEPPLDVSTLQRVWNLTDFCTFVDGVYEEIISGGVPRDGIPPIDDPGFETVEAAREWLQDQSPVIAVQIGETARAYPLAIMTRHEIVNDVFDDQPVAVTFCPLCNSALVFDRMVEGETLRFGVSGLLRNSDLIMWDDVTQTWWQQFTGQGLVGQYTGHQLDLIPSLMVSFGAFAQQFPDGAVLMRPGAGYGVNPYQGYDTDPGMGRGPAPFLFRGALDERLPATERVLAGLIDGEPVAYPFSILSAVQVINDMVGDAPVVAFWQPGKASALDSGIIDRSRDVGMAALFSRALDGETLTFSVDADGVIRDEATGSAWNMFGTAVEGELAGAQLAILPAAPHFWFAWAAFQPQTALYE